MEEPETEPQLEPEPEPQLEPEPEPEHEPQPPQLEPEPEPRPEAVLPAGGLLADCSLIEDFHTVGAAHERDAQAQVSESYSVSSEPRHTGKGRWMRRRGRLARQEDSSFTLSRSAVLVKSVRDGRAPMVELPYEAVFAVARRELEHFQLIVQANPRSVAPGAAPVTTETLRFWGAEETVASVSRRLDDLLEDRRYEAVAGKPVVESVRRLRRRGRGEGEGEGQESRTALVAWLERQLFSTEAREQKTIAAFHGVLARLRVRWTPGSLFLIRAGVFRGQSSSRSFARQTERST